MTILEKRSSGILAHITSLPSPFGIGDIGPVSCNFIDFLVECDQSYWQFLPTGPTNSFFDNSPYMSISASAGSPLLISPELLVKDGLISKKMVGDHPAFSPYFTDFKMVEHYKTKVLQEAFLNFNSSPPLNYHTFVEKNSGWLADYALFMSLKEHYPDRAWNNWPTTKSSAEDKELNRFLSANRDTINYYLFEQYIFFSQWQNLHDYAQKKEIFLFGDLPIYVGFDSADVWANRDIFFLNPKNYNPVQVSGVPPDYFSKTGQRWGNPLYNWHHKDQSVRDKLFSWWLKRLSLLFEQVDIARIDHFRGFESYWAIPAKEKTAVKGKWLKGPGKQFFDKVLNNLGALNIVAEDLGIITPEVEKLRDELNFPGMKVLQFAFDGNPDNSHLPYNYTTPNNIVYTGTHDNDTSLGWFMSNQLDDQRRKTVKNMVNRNFHDSSQIHHNLIYLAQSSISMLTIFPLQDILGFGNDCKMNSPGVPEGNWKWRCSEEFLTTDIIRNMKNSTRLFDRGRKDRT